MAVSRSLTLWNVPRRIAWRVMIPKKISINRPWVVLSSGSAWWFAVSEPVEVTGEVADDAGVSGDFGVPVPRQALWQGPLVAGGDLLKESDDHVQSAGVPGRGEGPGCAVDLGR